MDCRTGIGESAPRPLYKKKQARSEALVRLCLRALLGQLRMFTDRRIERHQLPVSYTHLTLPTIYSV